MFAAERVSSVVGESSWHCGTDLFPHPLPAKPAGLAFLRFVRIGGLAGRTDQDRESDPSFPPAHWPCSGLAGWTWQQGTAEVIAVQTLS